MVSLASDKIYDFLEKDADHPISKDEFNLWAHEHIHHMTIDKVFPMFITTTDIPIQQKVVVEEPPAPFVYNSQVQEQEEEITIPIEIKIDENFYTENFKDIDKKIKALKLSFKINFILKTIPKEIFEFDDELINKIKNNVKEIIDYNKNEDIRSEKSYRRKIKKKLVEN